MRRRPADALIDLALWRHRELDREWVERMARDECGFCHGKPVINAASWFTLGVDRYAPCPRCGKTVEPAPRESGPARLGSPPEEEESGET
jgi:hypothetical protein